MERKIIIVDSAANSKVTVSGELTTFADLKNAARAAGVNIEGKDWLEGLTKTSPMSDDSILPTNVEFKGKVTNSLVYMLSNTNKMVKSGYDRKELGRLVKEYDLAEDLKKKYHKNWTNIKTDVLASEVAKYEKKHPVTVETEPEIPEVPEEVVPESDYKEKYEALVYSFSCALATLPENVWKDIEETTNNVIEESEAEVEDVDYSDDDIEDMFKE